METNLDLQRHYTMIQTLVRYSVLQCQNIGSKINSEWRRPRARCSIWLLWALLLLLAACAPASPLAALAPSPTPPPPATLSLPATPPPPRLTPRPDSDSQSAPVTLTVLYTNDEHGWMLGQEEGAGAANLVGLWRKQHGYQPEDDHFLVLSGGDNWTGPAISTWFQGESMVEVMNAMGYDAAAIGNHEFDFGLDVLKERIAQADFPYLSANLRYKESGAVPTDLGIRPYTIIDLGDLQVGVIGLTTTLTRMTTNPTTIQGFDFIAYAPALREFVPSMREAGADLILVPSHLCVSDLKTLSRSIQDLDIALLGGGHCNELTATKAGGIPIISSGGNLGSYAYATITYDPAANAILDVRYGVAANKGGRAEETVADVVSRWQAEADASLNEPIGYLQNEIPRRSKAMQDLITESWLLAYPNADIALTNLGGMRDRLPAGPITLADIISVMPFNNVLVEVHLTGAQLEQVLAGKRLITAVGGMHRQDGHWVLNKSGERLEKDKTYSVLVNDFMYAGGDGFGLLARFDPAAYDTGIDWRQPVIDWIMAQNSSAEKPLGGD